MPRILAISSQVACGHVGLSATIPAAQALGCDVIALPTIVLSNHPGHRHVSGTRIEPKALSEMLEALDANGWLSTVDTVLTGYLPSSAHVSVAADAISRTRSAAPQATIICDPVLGDDKEGVYIDEAAANAVRDQLLPISDIILPNRFELGWLAGRDVSSLETAAAAANTLPCRAALVTSLPAGPAKLANVLIERDEARTCTATERDDVPKGTGDFLSGCFAADPDLARTTARVAALVTASIGRDHLAIIEARDAWLNATPGKCTRVGVASP